MTHKFKKGQLVQYKFRNNAGKTEKGFGHIQARRSRYYLIKPNMGTEVVKVYCNQTFEIAVPPTATVFNEMPKKDTLKEKKESCFNCINMFSCNKCNKREVVLSGAVINGKCVKYEAF